jgi:hypothetical protein
MDRRGLLRMAARLGAGVVAAGLTATLTVAV